MSQSKLSLDEIFEAHIQTLAVTLWPRTILGYRVTVRRFLGYLHAAFPRVRRLAQLRRDPHVLGWFRWLCSQDPPLCNTTRQHHIFRLRRLLDDLATNNQPIQPDLIRCEDFPPPTHYLPRPLNPDEDQHLQEELRRTDDLLSNTLLLTRATGIRIGECMDLSLDCLRQLGQDQRALHVPLGKLHTERLVPADTEIRRVVARILALRALAPPALLAKSKGFLLPRGGPFVLCHTLPRALADAAARAGCNSHVTPHRLRHTYATEMLRLGVSLPALMQLLGHRDIRMSLQYIQVTQQDLQREFRMARQNAPQPHSVPMLPIPKETLNTDLSGIRQALAATRHLLEMFRRGFSDEKTRRRLQRLDRRLLAVADQLNGGTEK